MLGEESVSILKLADGPMLDVMRLLETTCTLLAVTVLERVRHAPTGPVKG